MREPLRADHRRRAESTSIVLAWPQTAGASRESSSRTTRRSNRRSVPVVRRRSAPLDERAYTEGRETKVHRRARGEESSMMLLNSAQQIPVTVHEDRPSLLPAQTARLQLAY